MTIRRRYQSWRQRRRWKRAERDENAPLREFVYLDDVSVYSLVASQVGLVVTELTETQATSLQSDATSSVGANAGFAKAEVGARVQAGETQSSQVLRKAIVQTTFKQLYDEKKTSLVMRPLVVAPLRFQARTLADLERAIVDDVVDGWIIDPDRLRRGQLLEMEVQLEAEPIFHAGAVISGILDIIQDDPSVFGVRDFNELAQVSAINRMLDKLLAGLVPLRGRAIDYEVVELRGREWIVHRSVLDQLVNVPTQTRPLYLVGVAEQALFWKDLRRVLFSGSTYRVLARLARDGAQQSWTPVKLVDLLRDVAPDFATIMDNTNRGVLSAMTSAVTARQQDSEAHRVRLALVTYASLLADRCGVTVSEEELEEVGLLNASDADAARPVREWRDSFEPITKFIETRAASEIDRVTLADYRIAARTRVGLAPGLAEKPTPRQVDVTVTPPSDERFLDAELVAIYW